MNPTSPEAQPIADRSGTTPLHWVLLPLLVVAVVVARWIQIATFGTDVPYWDQWDGEIAFLYKPFMEGTLSWQQFFAPHNEHRIFFSRLFNLGLFVANDAQFDNMVTAYANALLYAGGLTLFAWPVLRRLSGAALLLGWLVVVLAGILPCAVDNLLFGFQNQFYFLGIFTATALASIALGDGKAAAAWALVLAFMALFTVASGLLLAPAVAFVALVRWRNGQLAWGTALTIAAIAFGIAAYGYWLLPHVVQHDALRAHGMRDFFIAAINVASWPLPGGVFSLVLLWWPSAVALWRFVMTPDRSRSRIDLYLLAVCAWAFAQTLAVAHSRGHELAVIPTRYTDTLALAPLANLALAVRLMGGTAGALRGWLAAAAGACAIACLCGFALAAARATPDLFRFAGGFQKSRTNLRAYIANGDVQAFAGKPDLETTYPNTQRLVDLLGDPTVRAMLPSSIRPPLAATPAGSCTAFEPFGAYPTTPATPYAFGSFIANLGNPSTGTCSSAPFTSRQAYLRFRMAGYPHESGLSLTLVGVGRQVAVVPPANPRESWVGVTVPNPRGLVLWKADDRNPEFWFAFTLPVEVGRLSALRQRLDGMLDLAPPWLWQ